MDCCIINQAAVACPAYPVVYYSLTLMTNTTATDPAEPQIITSSNTTLIANDLQQNIAYSYTVQAHNAIGESSYGHGVFCKLNTYWIHSCPLCL